MYTAAFISHLMNIYCTPIMCRRWGCSDKLDTAPATHGAGTSEAIQAMTEVTQHVTCFEKENVTQTGCQKASQKMWSLNRVQKYERFQLSEQTMQEPLSLIISIGIIYNLIIRAF